MSGWSSGSPGRWSTGSSGACCCPHTSCSRLESHTLFSNDAKTTQRLYFYLSISFPTSKGSIGEVFTFKCQCDIKMYLGLKEVEYSRFISLNPVPFPPQTKTPMLLSVLSYCLSLPKSGIIHPSIHPSNTYLLSPLYVSKVSGTVSPSSALIELII